MKIKIMTFNDFLKKINYKKISFDEFLEKCKIDNKNIVEYFDKFDDDRKYRKNELLQNIYNVFYENMNFLKYVYKSYFYCSNFELFFKIKKQKLKNKIIDGKYTTNNKLKRFIRNIYFNEIFIESRKVFDNCTQFVDFFDIYLNYNFPKRFFIPSIVKCIFDKNFSGLFGFIKGTFQSLSIFNPYTAAYIFTYIFPGKKLFTPVGGWSSYLIGFYNSIYEENVTVDVIDKIKDINEFIHNDLYLKNISIFEENIKKQKTIIYPSEKLDEIGFTNEYKNYFDLIFFSPPYFNLEIYPGENQSINNYKTYEEWLEKYWLRTCEICNKVLNKNGIFSFVIVEKYYEPNLKKDLFISNDMFNFACKIFKHIDTYKIEWQSFRTRVDKKTNEGNFEYFYIFKKG